MKLSPICDIQKIGQEFQCICGFFVHNSRIGVKSLLLCAILVFLSICMYLPVFNFLRNFNPRNLILGYVSSNIESKKFEKIEFDFQQILFEYQKLVPRKSSALIVQANQMLKIFVQAREDSIIWDFTGCRPLPARDYAVSIEGGLKL